MSEKVFYKGKWRKVRCGCNDSWGIGGVNRSHFQVVFLDAVEGLNKVCPICGYYRWYNTKRRPEYES